MTYDEFLQQKRHTTQNYGIDCNFIPDKMFDFQKYVTEVVLTPFMGVGSEVYGPVSMGRKAIGIELKETYFKQAVKNLADVKQRFTVDTQQKMF